MRKSFLEMDSSSDEECCKSLNIFVIGDAKVGKTSLIHRIATNEFTLLYTKTEALTIYHDIILGSTNATFFDIPSCVSSRYDYIHIKPDVVLATFCSEHTYQVLWSILEKIIKNSVAELWFVHTFQDTKKVDLKCNPKRLFFREF